MIRRGFYCHPMKKIEYHNIFHYPTSVIHSVSSWPTWVNYCLISFTKWISFDFMSFFWPWLVYMLEKAMATHSSTRAWKIKWMEELGRLQSMGSQRVGHDWATSLSLSLSCIGEGNGNPFQCSCLENPRDGGTWWAAVYGVAQSWTRLKWLSSLHVYKF